MKKNMIRMMSLVWMSAVLASCSNNAVPQTSTSASQEVSAVLASNSEDNQKVNTVVSTVASDLVTYDGDDEGSTWEEDQANSIVLSGTSIGFEGTGAYVLDQQLTIALPGVYVISGDLYDGQIVVDLEKEGTVQLVLNGVNIKDEDSSPIYVKKSTKTIITLAEGTENIVSDGTAYSDTTDDGPSAAIFSKDDLTLNGTGTLTVNGNYNNGIVSKDDLKITGGQISINAADDGLQGRDLVAVKAGQINIKAAGDGIKSTNDADAGKGIIVLEGGKFDIKSGADGIQAETMLLITGGEYAITTGEGSAKSESLAADQSAKGLKATTDITISGGTMTIDSADDAVHSNNSLTIANGDISVTSGDDGLHADASITIAEGTINIAKSYEGIESGLVTIAGGEVHVCSSDDGINVGGGNDGSSVDGRAGQNTLATSGDMMLTISGGYIVVNAEGDGLDSNGSIVMSDGTVIVSGPTANNNGALDYNESFEMSGGFLIAAGSSGMAQATSEQSTQSSLLMSYSQEQQAGTLVHLEDSNGKTVATFAPDKNYQSVVINSPELKKDTSYTFYSGGTATGTAADGFYTDGSYQGGTEIVSFTIADTVTWLSESGITTAAQANPGGFGGGKGGFGGGGGGGPKVRN